MGLDRSNWVVIGIGGVTCGGKTSLAGRLRAGVSPTVVVHQDAYFLPDDSPRHTYIPELKHNNYDILSALDMDRMMDDIHAIMRGDRTVDPARVPNESRDGLGPLPGPPPAEPFSLPGKQFLVLEGLTVLNHPPLMELCDLRYYFVLEYEECLRRRLYRLYDPPDVPGYFELCVWPEHIKYRAEVEKDVRVKFLDGTYGSVHETVMDDIRRLAA
ncbi:nicotinamide riboside kinase 1 [Spodoptera frugiperda]|uniref:Nicotinamide riboside kinase 1 n=1 Tax=Spodoptera frugiperda TaxID=7108 RepID=A0A2H1VGW1_SPOFR|nr:nicotinamide riboside kinase 1 [Spodoptera frugiperda]